MEDIDGKRGLIHVRLGKGGKDRYVMLSERLLLALRQYWTRVRPASGWLFPGRKKGAHLHPTAVNWALKEAERKSRLKKGRLGRRWVASLAPTVRRSRGSTR